MTSTKLTLTQNSEGKYAYEFTTTTERLCVAAVMEHFARIGVYLVDSNLPSPVLIDFEQSTNPTLWISCISGMKLRIVSEINPTSIVMITD